MELHLKAGLIATDDGQWIGTKAQWNDYERLEEEDEAIKELGWDDARQAQGEAEYD